MSNRSIGVDEKLYNYLLSCSLEEHPVLAELRQETAKLPLSVMQIAPEQGQFMQLLVRLMGANRIIEVGTFTGYSSLSMALALSEQGKLITCDIDEEATQIAKLHWQKAGVQNKIELKLGPALNSLESLQDQKLSFDLAFIDADKGNYLNYYEHCLQLLRPGGLIVVDNVLWDGKVCEPSITDDDTTAIRRLNQHIHEDKRVFSSLIPVADGLYLAQKKAD